MKRIRRSRAGGRWRLGMALGLWASCAWAQNVYVEVVERSTPGGIVAQTSTTRLTSESHTTTTAPEAGSGYGFAHWTLNGARVGTDYGRALNPMTFIVTQAMDAVAVYLPTNQDTGGFGVPDWWQYRQYGTLTNAADSDTDGDGVGLAREYELGMNPQVRNTLDRGGISLRMSEQKMAVVDSSLVFYTERSLPGGFITAYQTMLTNGVGVTTVTAPASGLGYAFAYWTVNGERRANTAGESPNPISLVVTQTLDVVAVYVPTNQFTSGTGLPDWWLLNHCGTLTNAPDSDADGDGISLAGEYAAGTSPGVSNRLDGGGMSQRISELHLAVVNNTLVSYSERSLPGGFITARELILANGVTNTSATAPATGSGYAFSYWSVNGKRHANAADEAPNPLILAVTQNVEAVAVYLPTNQFTSGTGLPDWWLMNHVGSLTNGADSDADGDGISLAGEYAVGTSPGVPNRLDSGGVSLRVSELWNGYRYDSQSDRDGDGITMARELALGMNPDVPNTLDTGGVSFRISEKYLVDVQVLLGVFLEPEDAIAAGALWRVDGGMWYTNGQYSLMAAGPRRLEYRDADGWEAPAPQTVEIYHQILALTGTYVQVGMGELAVAIEPEAVRNAGARWRLDGPTWQTTNSAGLEWRTNGAVISLTARQQRPYGVIGKEIPGWHTPQSQEAWVTNGQRTEVTLTYSAAGYLAVTASPPAAAALGGWRVEEGDWHAFGESATLLVGDYEVEFQPVAGWHTPTNRSVTISQGATASLAVDYAYNDLAGCEPLPLDWKRTALASGEEAGPYAATHAVDDDVATRWRSPVANGQWLQMDLGRVSTLAGMTLRWDAAYAKVFTVESSLDGETWTEVAAQTNGVGGLETLYWPPRTARHIRLNLAERYFPQWGFGIWEIDFISPCGYETAMASEATWTPENPADDERVEVRYVPNDGPLAAAHATEVFVRYSVNGVAPTSGTDVAMTVGTNGVWTGSILPEPGDSRIDLVFHNGAGVWDATGGSAWGFALRPGAANVVRPDPGILEDYRDRVGMAYRFSVTGSPTGTIWGTTVYKDDSPLAVAAVHAGALTNGERGTLVVTPLGPQESFEGTESHGVVSLSYGAWAGSYSVVRSMEPELVLLGINGAAIAEGAAASAAAGTDFGRVAAGTAPTQTLWVVNTGRSDLEVTGAEIAGADSNAFQVLGLPLTVPAGETSAFHLVYSPQATAGEDAEVTLINNTVRSHFAFGVRGTVPRVLTMAGLQVNDKTYDGYISGTVASFGAPQVVEPGDVVTVNTARVEALFANANAGVDKPVTVTGWTLGGADAYKYDLGNQIVTATIHRATQTLSFTVIPDQDWTNRMVMLQASASSELPVTFEVTGPVTRSGNTLTFTSTGTVSVTASQSDSNWTPVTLTHTFEVYSVGRLTWAPLVPTAGQVVVFTYLPELGPLTDARTVYLDIGTQPDGETEDPRPAMKGDATNGWTAVYLVPETVTNLMVELTDETGVRDDYRGRTWQISVAPGELAATGVLHLSATRLDWTVSETDWTPASHTFVLKNTGSEPLDFVVEGAAAWLAISPNTGTLVGGGSLTAEVSWVETFLPVGGYLCTLAVVSPNAVNAPQYLNVLLDVAVSNAEAQVVLRGLEQVYDGTERVATAETDPQELSVAITYNGMSTAPTNAGSYTVVATVTDPGWIGSASGTLVVARAPQTISFPAIADQVVTGRVELSATASSGQEVAFEVSSGPAELSGGVLSFTGLGEVLVVARHAGDDNWLAAPDVTNRFAVLPAQAQVTLSHLDQTFDGTPRVVGVNTDPAGLAVEVTYAGLLSAPANAGTYVVTGRVTEAGYVGEAVGTLTVAKASQSISFGEIADRFWTHSLLLSATASSGLGVTFAVVSGPASIVNGNELRMSGYGRITVRASQGGNGNWSAAPANERSFTALGPEFMLLGTNGQSIVCGDTAVVSNGTDFGAVLVGHEALTRTFVLTNAGDVSLTVSEVQTNGSPDFRLALTSSVVAAGGAIDVAVTYEPQGGGSHAATFAWSFDGTNSPCELNVSGIGLDAGIALSSAAIEFHSVFMGVAPDGEPVLLENVGTRTMIWRAAVDYGSGAEGWLSIDPTNGTLAGGSVTTLVNSVNVTGMDVGSYVATNIIVAPDATNSPVSYVVTLQIAPASQTIDFVPIADQFVTGQVVLSATASSGLPVTFGVASGPAQISGGMLTFTGLGEVAVVASQPGNGNWEAAASVTNRFAVMEDVPDMVFLEISTSHGIGNPGTGRHERVHGTIVTNTMEGEVTDGLSQYVLNGFALEGAQALENTATSVVVRLTNDTRLVWRWTTNHWLAVGAGPHGNVEAIPGWRAAGAEVEIAATPHLYHVFDRWIGVDADQASDNPLVMTMTGPHSVQAIFKVATTAHGTPLWWLAEQGWTNGFEEAAADDPDRDGSPTWEEQVAGTDPNDPASCFQFHAWTYSRTNIGLYWPSAENRTYRIEYTTNLTKGVWTSLPDGEQIASDPPENQLVLAVTNLPERHRMFRVSVQPSTNGVRHEVVYVAGPNGTIGGSSFQELGSGETGQQVWAIPDDGYEFVRWSDGSTDNPRMDVDVNAAQVLTAEFAPIATPPPEGQAIESVRVNAPIVRSMADGATIEVESVRNCHGTVEIRRTDVAVTPAGVIQYTSGAVVRRLKTPLMAGRTRVAWDGRDDNGMGCSNGLYQFRILATNAHGEAYQSYDPVASTNAVVVESAGIQPAAPRFRANEPCRMGYTLGTSAAMAVFVGQEGAIWDFWVQFREAGRHLDDWGGRHSRDGQLLNGAFALEVLARELPENAWVLDRQLLIDVEAEIYAIRPVYDQVTTLNYTLTSEADVWVELQAPGGATALLSVEGLKAPGRYSFVWDGRVSGTRIFAQEGDYTLRIAASSEALGIEQGVSLNVMGI